MVIAQAKVARMNSQKERIDLISDDTIDSITPPRTALQDSMIAMTGKNNNPTIQIAKLPDSMSRRMIERRLRIERIVKNVRKIHVFEKSGNVQIAKIKSTWTRTMVAMVSPQSRDDCPGI